MAFFCVCRCGCPISTRDGVCRSCENGLHADLTRDETALVRYVARVAKLSTRDAVDFVRPR